MKKFWLALSATAFAGAALALWRHHLDAAFVIATVGALAWFLNYRSHLQESLAGELIDRELIVEPDRSISTTSEPNQSNEK